MALFLKIESWSGFQNKTVINIWQNDDWQPGI